MRKGYTYANVHTTLNGPGLIRGQIHSGNGHPGRGRGKRPLAAPFPVFEEPGRKAGLFALRAFFEPADHGETELGGAGSVDDAVVERERDVAGSSGLDDCRRGRPAVGDLGRC